MLNISKDDFKKACNTKKPGHIMTGLTLQSVIIFSSRP